MRGLVQSLFLGLVLTVNVSSQSHTFTKEGIEYVLDLPTLSWQVVSRVDVHPHVDFVNGSDELNGYLRLTRILVNSHTTVTDLIQSDEKLNLQHLPGYVACGDCKGQAFTGQLTGATFSYEYSSEGHRIAGRVYYLEVDSRTFYALRFTVAQEKLKNIAGEMDFIARSFRLK
jgi:hypothetical protein